MKRGKRAVKQNLNNPKKADLFGVKGWLFLFALFLVLGIPFITLKAIFGDSALDMPSIIFDLFVIVFSIFAGVSIFLYKKNAIVWARQFLIVYLTLQIINLIMVPSFIASVSNDETIDPILIPVLFLVSFLVISSNIIFSIIWLLYLRYSRRVNATFKDTVLSWKRIVLTVLVTILVLVIFSLIPF